MKLKIDRKTLQSMLLCQASNDVRYYLNGVCFRADGLIAATNGHICLIGHHDNKIKEDIIVSIGKIPTQAYDHAIIDTKEKIVSFMPETEYSAAAINAARIGVTICHEIDGRFPDVTRVIPKDFCSVGQVGFHAGYLGLAEKIAKIANPQYGSLKFLFSGETGAAMAEITITGEYDKPLKYIVMPMRL